MQLPLMKFVAATVLALSLTGCATYHVYQIGGPGDSRPQNNPDTEWESKTRHALLWGAARQDLPVENCQLTNGERLGMEEVKVERNFGQVLASILSLGAWNPLTISWRCNGPPVQTGTLGEAETDKIKLSQEAQQLEVDQ